jgi:hypothetical protein
MAGHTRNSDARPYAHPRVEHLALDPRLKQVAFTIRLAILRGAFKRG